MQRPVNVGARNQQMGPPGQVIRQGLAPDPFEVMLGPNAYQMPRPRPPPVLAPIPLRQGVPVLHGQPRRSNQPQQQQHAPNVNNLPPNVIRMARPPPVPAPIPLRRLSVPILQGQPPRNNQQQQQAPNVNNLPPNVIPIPQPPPQARPEVPLHIAEAEADKVMEVFPNIEKDFLVKYIREHRFQAQGIIHQITYGTIEVPKIHSPGRIPDISMLLLDEEKSIYFSANSGKETQYGEEVKQQLLQRLEAGLKIAYTKLRHNTLENRFKLEERVDFDYMSKTVAPNLYVAAIKTVMDYALTAENGFLAVLLLSRFEEEENTRKLVSQLFFSQMKTVQALMVVMGENEVKKLIDQFDFCYKQKGREPCKDFGTPPQCFRKIVDIVRKLLEKSEATFECEICADDKPVAKSIECESMNGKDKGSEHKFCIDCVKRYADASISEPNVADGGEGLRCMHPSCKRILKHAAVISCISKNQKQTRRLLEKRFATATMIASGIQYEECHFCSYAEIIEESPEVNKVFNCIKCKAKFCRICKELWKIHIGRKCQEVADEKKTTAEERARVKLEEELSKVSIRYCQHCNIAFNKEKGCNKMTCRCGRFQCYMCNVLIKDYSHFCRHTTDPKLPGVCPQNCGKCMLWANPKTQEVEARKKLIDSYKGQISEDKLRLMY